MSLAADKLNEAKGKEVVYVIRDVHSSFVARSI